MTPKELYQEFKSTKQYTERKQQTGFCEVAREAIGEKLKMDKFTKLDLTGFIQMFAWRGDNSEMFNKYFDLLGFDEKYRKRWMTMILEYGAGYTAVGRTAITKLAPKNAILIKNLLQDIRNVRSVEGAKRILQEFEKNDIPYVKMGIYSPWVHYLQPTYCPIVNKPVKEQLEKLNWDGSYIHAFEIFHRIAAETGEEDLGILDAMIRHTPVANKLIKLLKANANEKINKGEQDITMKSVSEFSLNTILYGPPGTGKTYNSINYALAIIHNDPGYCVGKKRKELVEEFNRLKDEGVLEFITFHQSYHYEDFIEGIRPYTENDVVKYRIDDGIFKKIASRAQMEFSLPTEGIEYDFTNIDYYKMSLGDTSKSEEDIVYDYCMENNCVALGWGEDKDFSEVPDTGSREESLAAISEIYGESSQRFGVQAIYYFKNLMKANDLVFISNGNTKIRAIGRIVGGYECRKETPIAGYYHFRKVQWYIKDADIASANIYEKILSQQSIYKLAKKHLYIDRIQRLLDKKKDKVNNYVLIIDEINRGNISKIFGELITLIEDDKRLGKENQITAHLPYSGTQFGVPSNLFILGTMNTADRSTALVDIALRRRFSFVPLYPDYETINNDEMRKLLESINSNIVEELGPDYQIGHSYFIGKTTEDLSNILNDKVLPLLNEYFYGDNEKILSMFSGTDLTDCIQFDEFNGKKLTKGRLSYQA